MDFVIENGVLKKYTGTSADVIIPDGVTEIGDSAFRGVQQSEQHRNPKQCNEHWR